MKFIELTVPNGTKVLINPQRIASLAPTSEGYEDKTYVDMGDDGYRVRETMDEIITMNERINPEGGRAFPCGFHRDGNSADQQGMSLRDYFAGQALAGMLANGFQPNQVSQPGNTADFNYATAAYRMAQAMIAARNQTAP